MLHKSARYFLQIPNHSFLTSGALFSSFLAGLVLGLVVEVVGKLELVSVEGAVSLVEGVLFFSFSVVVVSCVVSAVVVCRCFSSAKAGFVVNPRNESVMALAKSVFFHLFDLLFF